MAEQPVLYEVTDGIAVLTLNNPRKHNALSNSLLRALHSLLQRIKDDAAVRVVVLRSEGPVFSSGHDLRELIDGDRETYSGIFEDCTLRHGEHPDAPQAGNCAGPGVGHGGRMPARCNLRPCDSL